VLEVQAYCALYGAWIWF